MKANLPIIITSNRKQLVYTAVSHSDSDVPNSITKIVKDAFRKLSPYINDSSQNLYIQDIPLLTHDEIYPRGHSHNRHEAMIAIFGWDTNQQQLKASINHELHHMARWQNAGYGDTLGGAILSEGIASYYEELQSGWTPPWAQAKLTNSILLEAIDNWDNDEYNHDEWFFDSKRGHWLGYAIGYKLAKVLYKDGFDLKQSVLIKPSEVKEIARKLTV